MVRNSLKGALSSEQARGFKETLLYSVTAEKVAWAYLPVGIVVGSDGGLLMATRLLPSE